MFSKLFKAASKGLIALSLLAALLPASTALAFNSDPNVLDIDGSTTLYPVIRMAQTQFPLLFPGTTVNATSTGSGHGQTSIGNKYVDIGMSSSSCKPENMKVPNPDAFTTASYSLTTANSPLQCTNLTQTVVARDGLTIIVHVSKLACVTNITRDQIGAIYRGEINNWNQLNAACASETLVPRARIVGSGTRQSLLDLLGSARLTSAQEQATISATGLARAVENSDLELFIAQNPSHFGYGGMINTDSQVRSLTVEGVAPTIDNVRNGSYVLSRPLYLFTAPTSDNGKARIQDFLNWNLSPAGQAAWLNEGYVNINTAAPNWDVNVDRVANVLDLTAIGGFFGQVGPSTGDPAPLPTRVRGWVRADVNFDGQVSVLDLTSVGGNFGRTW